MDREFQIFIKKLKNKQAKKSDYFTKNIYKRIGLNFKLKLLISLCYSNPTGIDLQYSFFFSK